MSNQSMYNKAFWNTMRTHQEIYSEMSNMKDSTGSYPAPSNSCTATHRLLKKKISSEELVL